MVWREVNRGTAVAEAMGKKTDVLDMKSRIKKQAVVEKKGYKAGNGEVGEVINSFFFSDPIFSFKKRSRALGTQR